MGHNPSRNPFRRTRLGLDDQRAVDAYKMDSVWGAWWRLDESTRRRYFSPDERRFIRRYGAKLDEIACLRASPANDAEAHFLQVCQRQAEPRTGRERLWLYVQLVCRYERSLERAARTDLAEHDAEVLRIDNRRLRADLAALAREYLEVLGELKMERGDARAVRPIGNVVWATGRFAMRRTSPDWTMFPFRECR